MDTLDELADANYLRDREWDPTGVLDLSFFGNELGGECGEAQNVIKKLERERLGVRGKRDTPEHLMEELADLVIVASIISNKVGGDLGKAVRAKFNKTSEENNLTVFMETEPARRVPRMD